MHQYLLFNAGNNIIQYKLSDLKWNILFRTEYIYLFLIIIFCDLSFIRIWIWKFNSQKFLSIIYYDRGFEILREYLNKIDFHIKNNIYEQLY